MRVVNLRADQVELKLYPRLLHLQRELKGLWTRRKKITRRRTKMVAGRTSVQRKRRYHKPATRVILIH
jgi:hypothetical protein